MNKDDYGGPAPTDTNSDMQSNYFVISVPKRIRKMGLSDWFSNLASVDNHGSILSPMVFLVTQPHLLCSLVLWLS